MLSCGPLVNCPSKRPPRMVIGSLLLRIVEAGFNLLLMMVDCCLSLLPVSRRATEPILSVSLGQI